MLPCSPLVKAYITRVSPKWQGLPQLTDRNAFGKIALRMLEGKSSSFQWDEPLDDYNQTVILWFSERNFKNGRCSFSPVHVRELNCFVKAMLEEQLYMHLMISWKNEPTFNIADGVRAWQATLGIDENTLQLPTVTKNFYNWRKRYFPNAIRTRGHFHNSSPNISFYAQQ